jgi:regulator of cell morphogenesis and NO signaling
MPTSTQSIREIVATHQSAARIFERFDIDLCLQAENSLDRVCAELQLSVDQVLEKLADAEAQEHGSLSVNAASLSIGRLVQHIVRIHHQCVRRELPRLYEMAHELASKGNDFDPQLKNIEALLNELRADMLAHIQKEEQVLFSFIYQMDQESTVASPLPRAGFRSISNSNAMMMHEHESAKHIMAEIRRITTDFEVPEGACATHAALFAGLRAFEKDLKQHLHLESDVLFPRAIKLEAELNSRG